MQIVVVVKLVLEPKEMAEHAKGSVSLSCMTVN